MHPVPPTRSRRGGVVLLTTMPSANAATAVPAPGAVSFSRLWTGRHRAASLLRASLRRASPATPGPETRGPHHAQDQGCQPCRRHRRRRDDPDHLAPDQGEADLPVSRHRPVLGIENRDATEDKVTVEARRSSASASASSAPRSRRTRPGSRSSASGRCGSRPTARSATSSAASSSASRSSARTCHGALGLQAIIVGFGVKHRVTDFAIPASASSPSASSATTARSRIDT